MKLRDETAALHEVLPHGGRRAVLHEVFPMMDVERFFTMDIESARMTGTANDAPNDAGRLHSSPMLPKPITRAATNIREHEDARKRQ